MGKAIDSVVNLGSKKSYTPGNSSHGEKVDNVKALNGSSAFNKIKNQNEIKPLKKIKD